MKQALCIRSSSNSKFGHDYDSAKAVRRLVFAADIGYAIRRNAIADEVALETVWQVRRLHTSQDARSNRTTDGIAMSVIIDVASRSRFPFSNPLHANVAVHGVLFFVLVYNDKTGYWSVATHHKNRVSTKLADSSFSTIEIAKDVIERT